MQQTAFEAYMLSRNLADKTREQRGYALLRIERAYGVNLDREYARDKLRDLIASMTYGSADAAAQVANPSKLDIEPDKLLTHLRWYKSHLVDYARFMGSLDGMGTEEPENVPQSPVEAVLEEAVGRTFALERDLQAALRRDLAQLEPGLRAIDGGVERRVEAGFIDITARDAEGIITVIELKAEATRPDAIAQVLSYMACIADEEAEPVRGILLGSDHHPRVQAAARAIPNLQLKSYRYRFDFS